MVSDDLCDRFEKLTKNSFFECVKKYGVFLCKKYKKTWNCLVGKTAIRDGIEKQKRVKMIYHEILDKKIPKNQEAHLTKMYKIYVNLA